VTSTSYSLHHTRCRPDGWDDKR